MPIKDITCDTSVADLVTYVELSSIQYAFGWNSWVSTRAASQLWNMEKKRKRALVRIQICWCHRVPLIRCALINTVKGTIHPRLKCE